VRYADDPDPDAWRTMPTWDETPVMPASCKPLSFRLNRPLARRQPATTSDVSATPQIEPISLPPPTYLPPPQKKPGPVDEFFVMIDGRRHLKLDGMLIPTFWEVHPGPQSRYPAAVPVPGLSKKTRGRTAPTKEMGVRKGTTYTCKVEGCRKTFTRHEHLKRHVRSLHMHEKNYMCALPFCDKTFARRDNLLQHERKHKHYQAFFDCTENYEGELMPQFRPRPYEPEITATSTTSAANPAPFQPPSQSSSRVETILRSDTAASTPALATSQPQHTMVDRNSSTLVSSELSAEACTTASTERARLEDDGPAYFEWLVDDPV